jgi:predicted TIM-barrel fold metal-dependent hydrolase
MGSAVMTVTGQEVAAATLRGRINDNDSHEMIPCNLWAESFGDIGDMLATLFLSQIERVAEMTEFGEFLIEVKADDVEITSDSVWKRAGWEQAAPKAPGAIDMARRLDVLDLMGVQRQFVFPTFGLLGMVLSHSPIAFLESFFGEFPPGLDPEMIRGMGQAVSVAYNDWAIEQQRVDPDRVRMVGVAQTADFETLMAETERLLAGGVRSLWIPASVPPGGKSPADRAVAPFWKLCEEGDVTVHLHLAFEEFMRTFVWRQVPEFENDTVKSAEYVVDPWSLATQHMAPENFLTTMALGGVFERHPDLRFGVIECGAHWFGPMAENLDKWAKVFKRRMTKVLSLPPSAYLARNVRVTPFWFEPVATYVERYGLEDVYVYGSDYPHIEGGTNQLATFTASTGPLGPGFAEKFFVTNADLLMPPVTA